MSSGIELIGSVKYDRDMARPRNFSREGVLEKALPVFWKHGFADASLLELEKATGVNKSGLYSEFSGKEDLFLESLRFYLDRLPPLSLLTVEPLGWDNIEQFLKLGPRTTEGQKGCFAVSSMRELAILPPAAIEMLGQGRVQLKQLIAKNIEAEKPKADVNDLASMVLTFFTGLSVEQNLKSSRAATGRKIDNLMQVLRSL
jgi:TetR/AcrR family transcriptional regulator, copper-responsive repressor